MAVSTVMWIPYNVYLVVVRGSANAVGYSEYSKDGDLTTDFTGNDPMAGVGFLF